MKAFPTEIASPPGYRRANYDEGMDLRDYFAAKAMQGMIANYGIKRGKGADENDALGAERAYKIADAMMKAREKNT